MIKTITLKQKNNTNETVKPIWSFVNNVLNIEIEKSGSKLFSELKIIIEFTDEIVEWRNFNYRWVDCSEIRIANYYSPKLLKLSNGFKVAASVTTGAWYFDPKYKNHLIWVLTDRWLTPVIQFDKNGKRLFQEPELLVENLPPLKLLFTKESVTEWSRSKYPFSAIVSFTDHCDFDSELLLAKQRQLFATKNIKVTKGLFFYHHSKREFNTSLEREKQEYDKWTEDGHELACHSLTQSFRQTENEWKKDVDSFLESDYNISTWIDHGYQPYNITMQYQNEISSDSWLSMMEKRGIRYIWTYLDSGTSGKNTLNQIDHTRFTLGNKYSELSGLDFKERWMQFARYLFLFHSKERDTVAYRKVSGIIRKKSVSLFIRNIGSVARVIFRAVNIFLSWSHIKDKPAQSAKYSPLIFDINSESTIRGFQTVEVSEFRDSFNHDSLSEFINDAGVCIAHTYFSVLLLHYKGRMFKDSSGTLNDGVEEAFSVLGKFIGKRKIWNPTLNELGDYFRKFEALEFILDDNNNVVPEKDFPGITFRNL